MRSPVAAALVIACAVALGSAHASGEAAPSPAPRSCAASDERPVFVQVGIATWYRGVGRKTARGDRLTAHAMTAAHRTLPFGTIVLVTNLENGRTVKVTINDRGPWARRSEKRVLDLARPAALALGFTKVGKARVKIEEFLSDQPGG